MKTYLDMDEVLRHCRRYIGQEYDEPYLVSAVPEEVIRSLPAADVVERKTAKWRYQVLTVPGGKGQTYAKWSCSRCHKKEKKRSPYCQNCGAEMENYDG